MVKIKTGELGLLRGSGKLRSFPGIHGSLLAVDELMDRVTRHSDHTAFELLFNAMYPELCRFCLKFVLVREVAEELVSDVFHSIWQNRERIVVSSARAYLFIAVRNRGFDYLRKTKRATWCDLEEASHIPGDLPDSHDMLAESELSLSIRRSVEALPRQCKTIFQMSREQGLKYREIASVLNISIKTVETQMGRALRHLQQSIPSV